MKYTILKNKPFGLILEANDPQMSVAEIDPTLLHGLFLDNQLLVLRGFRAFLHADDFADYCARWGEVSVWPFGRVLELVEHAKPSDHIFDHSYVPLHWDGMYRPQVPEFQIFHCVRAPLPGHGGRTTFSNTRILLERATTDQHSRWQSVTGVYKRKMEFYESTTKSPIITQHPLRAFPVIRYNEPPNSQQGVFVNPPDLEFREPSGLVGDGFHDDLRAALYHPENFYAHEWKTDDVVIADNFTLLHGREGFVSKSPRHLRRVHVLSSPPLNNPGLESYS